MCQKLQMKENPVVTCPFFGSRINAYFAEVRSNLRTANDTASSKKDTMEDQAILKRRGQLLTMAAAFDHRHA